MAGGEQKKTVFGEAVSGYMEQTGTTQTMLAVGTDRSRSYVNHTLAGRKNVSPEWVRLVADVMDLPAGDRAQLMRAAAIDAGFELDLTKM